jgi:general secretion pathway protein M
MTLPAITRGRGWVLVAVLAVAVLVLCAGVTAATELFSQQQDEIAQARDDSASYRALIAARPYLEKEYGALARSEAGAASLLHGDSVALAAAEMQNLVKALVERHGGQLRSAQLLSGSPASGLEKVVVQYELSIPLGALKSVTYQLETGRPYLFLDEVEIRPESYAGASSGAPGNLNVEWTIHGYRRQEDS